MKRRILVFLVLFCVLAMQLQGLAVNAGASEGADGKLINVVYDDSGSMVKEAGNYIMRWSQAKYAVEVFAAMMGKADEMNIYPMSLEGGLGETLKGTDPNRVKQIHDMNARYHNTPFTTVSSAAKNLLETTTDKEKWLVIITDGEFDDGATPVDTVYDKINECNDNGIKVIYLAIGESASNLTGNNNKGFYSEKASDGPDVLDKVMKMANQIFTHMVLPQKKITTSGDTSTLDIDIPIDKIMIFAQGDDVSVSGFKLNGEEIKASEIENVKYSDVKPENYPDAVIDTSLKGVIATYESGDKPFESGKYQVNVSGAQNIQYYYSPGVEVNCNLLLNGGAVSQDEELYAGDYEIEMNFVDPTNGNTVTSDLLSDASFYLGVENNGAMQSVDGTKGKVKLEEGEVLLDAMASFPGEVTLINEKRYTVLPEPLMLNLSISGGKDECGADEIVSGSNSYTLKVTDAGTGAPLSADETEKTNIKVSDPSGMVWDVAKGDETSTWILTPHSSDGSIAAVPLGNFNINISADYQIDTQYAYGSARIGLAVTGYEGDTLILEVDSKPDSYSMDSLEKEGAVSVKVYIENEKTGERELVSPEIWNALDFNASSKSKLSLECEKSGEVGALLVHPGYFKEDPLKTTEGESDIIVTATGSSGERSYLGETSFKINISELSKGKWLLLMAPKLIAMAIALFILIGYLKKKRIKTKGLNPKNYYKRDVSGKRKIKKKPLSVLLPYVDEVAVVKCHNMGYECYFPDLVIKATSKNGFRILNYKQYIAPKKPGPGTKITKIEELLYTEPEELKKRSFSYSAFSLKSTDSAKTKLGTFRFI